MKIHYKCEPAVWHEKPLIFDWDIETGEVSGPDADTIKEMAEWGSIHAHPYGNVWHFSSEPLTNKTDMAAIIGKWWLRPEDFIPFYPKFPEDSTANLPPGVIFG